MGKESSESLRSLEVFNGDITELKNQGTVINREDGECCVFADVIGHIMDRKAAQLHMGLGGSYCDLCSFSKEQCLDPTLVRQGFQITCSIVNIQIIFEELVQEDGEVKKTKNDYESRQPQDQLPPTQLYPNRFSMLY